MCQNGYVEVDGDCVYDFTADVNADGTPKTEKENWWDKVGDIATEYGPLILIGAGTWWQNKQKKDDVKPADNGGAPKPPAAEPSKPNIWLYVGIGAAVLVVAVLLLRRKGMAPALQATR